jgi:hypothetical protein
MSSTSHVLIELTRLGLPGFIVSALLVFINNRKEVQLKDKENQLANIQKEKELELERVKGTNSINLIREQREYAISIGKAKFDNEIDQRKAVLDTLTLQNEAAKELHNYSKDLVEQQNNLSQQQTSLVIKVGGWVELVNASIRPAISVCILLLVISITGVYMHVAAEVTDALMDSKDYRAVLDIGRNIFDTGFFLDLRSVFTNVITFWFGERASLKLSKGV